jgi:protein-L-isoaspartate(D-aspartate) O-methyltransferase
VTGRHGGKTHSAERTTGGEGTKRRRAGKRKAKGKTAMKDDTQGRPRKLLELAATIAAILLLAQGPGLAQQKYDEAREKMVKTQIEAREIEDAPVLSAMRKVPRHLFVPPEERSRSYEDHPLPIGYGQTISQPYIVALMTELLRLKKGARVLEVGTGSGYQAAILSEIVDEVYTVELIPQLATRAEKTLKELGYRKVHVAHRDGYYGWKERAPYDAIIVTAAAEFIPPPLIQQLKVGGLMCIPVGPPFSVQNLFLVSKKSEKEIETRVITQVAFVPLVH